MTSENTDTHPQFELREFGDAAISDELVAALADLHTELLPHSPVVLLGQRFMRDFYYRCLPQIGVLRGAVMFVDQQPAGLIVTTNDSDGFMQQALRHFPLRLLWVLLLSVLLQPSSLGALYEAWKIMRGRVLVPENNVAELLSFGVLATFRGRRFRNAEGMTVAAQLFDTALRQLRATPAVKVRALVDKTNTHVKLMYSSLGWTLSKTDVPGWRTPQVEFSHPLLDTL